MTSLATRSNSRNQYNGTYILGRWVYAGYLRSFNEAIRVGIANSSGLTRRSLTAELLNIKADMSIAVENQNSALILLPTNSTNTQESPALVNPKKMCRFRRVCNNYLCGHQMQLPDEYIQCYRTNCKFSPNHDPNCVLPKCRSTCTQTHGYPEQYSPHVQRMCPSCQGKAVA